MDERRPLVDRLGAIEGAEDGALGVTPPPEPPSPAAEVADEEHLVPGATHGERLADESKPWFTSLAAESHQAGVANDPPDAQRPDTLDPDDEDDEAL